MYPGSSRFGAGIVDNSNAFPNSPQKKATILSKRNGMPERTDGAVGTLAGILSKAVGLTGKHPAPAPSRDSVMSPTSLSPSRTFSPTRELSPTRSVSSSRVFSPTRELPSTSRAIFSPTREVSSHRVTSPTPDRYLSPSRDRAFSPQREYPRLFSPTREHSGSRMLASMREFSSSRKYSPSRDCSSSRLMSPSRVMSPPRYGRSPSVASNGYLHSRSPSPVSYSSRSCSMMSSTDASFPRRVFPQTSARTNYSDDLDDKEDAPVVFNAGMSFVMGMKNQSVRQEFKPVASHTQSMTASSTLSSKIKDFLHRTDHVMEEWKRLGKKDVDLQNGIDGYTGRSRSATNILIKGFQMYSRNSSSLRSPSVARVSEADTISEVDELSEMTADLAEEHSTSTLATERLEAETADRLRLEKELQDVQTENKGLQQATERLEMELLYMRAADVNGGVGSDEDEEGEGDAGVYKQRYERTVRELEFTRRRLQQQHEDDLEQLVGLKKQLEKKLADAFEEVEEQRQVVGQWKRKVQKLTAETNDLRLLLEEQNSRNHLLEKKQRKFDSELQLMQDELRQEKQQKDRISREKELVVAEKYSLEQNLSAVRLELELKEEKVVSLARELDELTFGGKTEEEVAHLKKTKHEMDKKLKEQEEELDDLAGQVQLLEQAKLRLEMSLEQQRKENRRELSQRDEELEDVRCSAQKKVKALEAQLESEHEERTQLLREKHELERRLGALEEMGRASRATDEDQLHRLRKDLRRTKALLRDAQTQLERSRGDSPGKAILRQLRNQLEDLEVARAAAVKARQSAEMELGELQVQLDEAQRVKAEAEERAGAAVRERSDIRTQLEENEEELAEVLKKYRAAVQQLSVDQMALQEQAGLVAELESERASLKEQLAELSSRLESIETQGDTSSSLAQRRLELRTKELESRLELEQTTRARMEISRLKETVEKLQGEAAMARAKEQTAQDAARKLQRSVRELKEEATSGQAREAEANQRRKDLEKRLESAEAEAAAARGDLRLALTRIQDLQSAIQGELEDCSGSDHSDSEQESDCSDESINTFLSNHKTHSNSSQRVYGKSDQSLRDYEERVKRIICVSSLNLIWMAHYSRQESHRAAKEML
ncbi:hypothetical protein C0J52_11149 [Blattella germanica]|nr:hypothetical protein C0J52_11149 [Blattella germanica]